MFSPTKDWLCRVTFLVYFSRMTNVIWLINCRLNGIIPGRSNWKTKEPVTHSTLPPTASTPGSRTPSRPSCSQLLKTPFTKSFGNGWCSTTTSPSSFPLWRRAKEYFWPARATSNTKSWDGVTMSSISSRRRYFRPTVSGLSRRGRCGGTRSISTQLCGSCFCLFVVLDFCVLLISAHTFRIGCFLYRHSFTKCAIVNLDTI